MSIVAMTLTGDDLAGWIWSVWIDDLEAFTTEPMARADLAAALFSIQRDDSRKNPYLVDLSDNELFIILDGFFFGALHDALRASAEEQTWAKHLVSPAVPTRVSSRMYLIGGARDQERMLVWRNEPLRCYTIAEGSFDKDLSEIIKRLESG